MLEAKKVLQPTSKNVNTLRTSGQTAFRAGCVPHLTATALKDQEAAALIARQWQLFS